MKNAILLIAGIVLTLLFIIFPSQIFETGYYSNDFSNDMYDQGLYIITAIITAAIAWSLALVYYYVINSVSFSRWYHWLIMLAVAAVLSPIVCYAYPNSVFDSLGYDYTAQLVSFSIVDCVITVILFIIASFSVRWWSSNCRHTPIPE